MFWGKEAAFASFYAHWLSIVNFQLQNERKALLFLRMTWRRCDQITWVWASIDLWHNFAHNSNTPSLLWLPTVGPPTWWDFFVAYHVIYLVISSSDAKCMQQLLCRLNEYLSDQVSLVCNFTPLFMCKFSSE